MYWKMPQKEFNALVYEGTRKAQKAIVDSGSTPGLLAYADGRPVGWIALEPREHYPRLARSKVLRAVDDQPVWSITCFFVDRGYRRRGLMARLLRAAILYVRKRGGKVLEGYPVDPLGERLPDVLGYTGLVPAFLEAGFEEVARRSDRRPMFRYRIGG